LEFVLDAVFLTFTDPTVVSFWKVLKPYYHPQYGLRLSSSYHTMSTLQDNGLVKVKDMALASPFILSAAAFLLVACLIRFVLIRPSKLDLPVVDIPDDDTSKALLTGSAKVCRSRPTLIFILIHKFAVP
jgi:hypothetical protein